MTPECSFEPDAVAPRRVMHISIDGKPACAAKGGPHPMTKNPNESNCKRCLSKVKAKGQGA